MGKGGDREVLAATRCRLRLPTSPTLAPRAALPLAQAERPARVALCARLPLCPDCPLASLPVRQRGRSHSWGVALQAGLAPQAALPLRAGPLLRTRLPLQAGLRDTELGAITGAFTLLQESLLL